MKTIVKRKLTPLVVILVALIVVPVAYALFPAIQVMTELTVKEPLSLDWVTVSAGYPGGPPWVTGTCTISKQGPPFASCTVNGFAGETVSVILGVQNAGQADIPISVSTDSSSPDVTEEPGTLFCNFPAGRTTGSGIVEAGTDTTEVFVNFAISPSAAPGVVSLLVVIVR